MSISNVSSNNNNYEIYRQQVPYNFGSVTSGKFPPSTNYHQAIAPTNQGVPNTTPVVLGLPQTDDMELANKIAELGISNPFAVSKTEAPSNYKPTGTGELSPTLEGRADEIEGCPWEEYYA